MDKPVDQPARERFAQEWESNFAVSANAGSGKTTAISQRLASLALSPQGATQLARTAVVTYTNKAAKQIGQRARAVLWQRLQERPGAPLAPLDGLERAFFGTIHSFCLQLAQRYGHRLGVHLNPTVLAEDDERAFAEFLAQDPLIFRSLPETHWQLYLRFGRLDDVFPLVQALDRSRSEALRRRLPAFCPTGLPPVPLQILRTTQPKQARSLEKWRRNQEQVERWIEDLKKGTGHLGLPKPDGTANGVVDLYRELFQPLKQWVADVSGVLAAELAERYRIYRLQRGWQTYADQVELALNALRDREILDRIRADGWRIILDEAQDTDPQQFAVLVEITRPVGAPPGTWPTLGGVPPRPGHFCLVGDGQQSIYGSRADIRNFLRHLDAFRRGDGGEVLEFSVSFRAPARLIEFLNAGLPFAFGPERPHNLGLPPEEGAPAPLLQVPYQALAPRPGVDEGQVSQLPLVAPATPPNSVDGWMEEEARQLADYLLRFGPAGVGARTWGDVCLLAPRNGWLSTLNEVFRARGLKVALQQRKNRLAEHPVYAWLTGLLAVITDPTHSFEWFGVLREVFGVADELLAVELRRVGQFRWEEPEEHPEPLAAALRTLRPLILAVDDEGATLASFADRVIDETGLPARASALDGSGSYGVELERLRAEAQELSLAGAGPREWARALLEGRENGRPAGQPEADAINLLTVHSAKGLEWPVVILVGLWRAIGSASEHGFKWLEDPSTGLRVFYSASDVPEEWRESRQREVWREQVRLLYVAMTRPQRHLVLPWGDGFGKGGRSGGDLSFAELWGDLEHWQALPEVKPEVGLVDGGEGDEEPSEDWPEESFGESTPAAPLPERVLPHQLAHAPDPVRRDLDTGPDPTWTGGQGSEEAVDYGLWWHRTLEHWPWTGSEEQVAAHVAKAKAEARVAGWTERAETELALFLASPARSDLTDTRWRREAELNLLAPLGPGRWIDGVVDLILHDPEAGEVWVVDWKTNRRRWGEEAEAMAERLRQEYTPQLAAYREGLRPIFPGVSFALKVYATALGRWVELT